MIPLEIVRCFRLPSRWSVLNRPSVSDGIISFLFSTVAGGAFHWEAGRVILIAALTTAQASVHHLNILDCLVAAATIFSCRNRELVLSMRSLIRLFRRRMVGIPRLPVFRNVPAGNPHRPEDG